MRGKKALRIVITPAGSRGDFQPLLALAVGLQAAGHRVLIVATPNFASEAKAFGVPVRAIGFDVEAFARRAEFSASPLRGGYELFKVGRNTLTDFVDQMLKAARGADIIVGSGAQLASSTVAEVLGVPYVFVAFTPQILRSADHPPIAVPFFGLPRAINRGLWGGFIQLTRAIFAGPLNAKRRQLGLAPVRDWYDIMCPKGRCLLAADPELLPSPRSLEGLASPAFGSLHLRDERPLPLALQRFLDAGPPPLYVGFGSMPDRNPRATTKAVIEAARATGLRLVLSQGWAGLGLNAKGKPLRASDLFVTGPISHHLLFPRVAAVVHHGGAGTTASALRAGRAQLVVPHVFDQFQWGRWVKAAGVGPTPIARAKLTVKRLSAAFKALLGEYDVRAAQIARSVRKRDPMRSARLAIEKLAR